MKKSPNTLSPAPPSAGSRVGRSSNASMRPPSFVSIRGFSPYRGLSQWDRPPTPPLIQLDPSAPLDWVTKQNETSHQSNHVHHQPSLLDLDDNQDQQHAGVPGPGDQYAQRERQLEADFKLAKALQEELNSADQEGRPLRSIAQPLPPSSFEPRIPTRSASQELCDQCEIYGIERSYCNVCDGNFCTECWEKNFAHKKKRRAPGAVPHERSDYVIAKKIKGVLESKPTDAEQEQLHKSDEDTGWFGILREEGELPLFQDYGRYASLMASTTRSTWNALSQLHSGSAQRDTRFPSLVSFVGETGAGKSTMIKLIIELNTHEYEGFATPVVGVAGRDVPTSDDVHLYLDPPTSVSDCPILYADCEGLNGGEREPIAARFRKREKPARAGRVKSLERKLRDIQHTSEREITWADTTVKKSREFAVTHLYPRLLYTFSDVIVFVLKEPRVIESVFEKLVNWAAAALEKSSNQPVLPHAIIVFNASANTIDERLWNVDIATTELMESLSRTVYHNATFKKYAQFWRERNRQIETVEHLLLSYYSSVQDVILVLKSVEADEASTQVVRIPTSGRPKLIQDQIVKLYHQLSGACAASRRRKGELRMLLDADELQPYLQTAFDHFASNLDTPFDFVQASFSNSPIPLDFGGNILKLAINLMEVWKNKADGRTIFVELSYMVASCIMLDSARHKIRGTAEQIFPQYLEHLDAALENFCDRHWPCEYIKPGGGGRCVNVRSGHGSKGHQLENGKVLAVGEYVSRFSYLNHHEEFQINVYSQLDLLLKALQERIQAGDVTEDAAAAEIHKKNVMTHFFEHVAQGQAWQFISHSACFSCLFEPPEHPLPCGHILCTPCLKAYGHNKSNTLIEIAECPLEALSRPRSQTWKVYLKPPSAGVRLMTLDGGGIRGIVELEILRQIERAMGGKIRIQSFFDLIIGTSTGGIIALGLGINNWSVEECIAHFEELCDKAFTRRVGGNIPGLGWFIDNYNHSKYETQPLEEALKFAFTENQYLFGGPRTTDAPNPDIKVGVTATSSAGSSVLLTNYNRLCAEKLQYHFQRPEKLSAELKTWEAARATSAAPRMFKPICHKPSKQVYLDGAIYFNNPILLADRERKYIWPNPCSEHPDIVLSIGTSYNPHSRKAVPEKAAMPKLGVFSHGKSLLKIAIDHIASALDSEKVFQNYMSILPVTGDHRLRYVRINPKLSEDPPRLDEVDRLSYIQAIVRGQMAESPEIKKIAKQLVATSFFFEKTEAAKIDIDGSVLSYGHMLCRLPTGSEEIRELGKLLRIWSQVDEGPYFLIQEEYRASQSAIPIRISSDVIRRMINDRQFRMSRIRVKMSKTIAMTEMFLCYSKTEQHPVSGFPRNLLHDELNPTKSRQALNANSFRWAGRTPSKQQRRKRWVAPPLDPRRTNTITRYSSGDHFLGDGSADALQQSAALLTYGPSPSIQNFRAELPNNEIPRPEAAPVTGEMSADPENEVFEMATSFNASPHDELYLRPAEDIPIIVPVTQVESASDDSDERHQILARALENRLSLARDLNLIHAAPRTPPNTPDHGH